MFVSSGYFLELLNRSAINLQEFFTSTWGTVYSQNSHVFSDLYTDLRHYYRGSHVNLEEVLNEFWAKLLEKLFTQANKPSYIGTANECLHQLATAACMHLNTTSAIDAIISRFAIFLCMLRTLC